MILHKIFNSFKLTGLGRLVEASIFRGLLKLGSKLQNKLSFSYLEGMCSTGTLRSIGKTAIVAGFCIIAIFVTSSSDLSSAIQQPSLPPNHSNQLITEVNSDSISQKLIEATRYVLVGSKVDLKVTATSEVGVLELSGFLSDNAKLQQVMQSILIDVADIKDLINNVLTPQGIIEEFNQILAEHELDVAVRLSLHNNQISVQGISLSAEQYAILHDTVLPIMTAKYAKVIRFVSNTPSPRNRSFKSAKGYMNVTVKGVLASSDPQVTMGDGKQYRVGDSPFPNWVVSKIDSPLVVFESLSTDKSNLSFCSINSKCLIIN